MDDVILKIKKTSHDNKTKILLAVEAPVEVSDKSYRLALKDVSENVDIPGFRKGKAPKEVIEKNFGVEHISQKAFERIFFEILGKAAMQEKLDILDVVEIKSYELLPGKPFIFDVVVELKPDVKLGKYKGLKVQAKKVTYEKDEFVAETIDRLAGNFVSFKKSDDGVLEEGDIVYLDFEGEFDDGTEVPGGKASNFQTVLAKDKLLPGFVDSLVGAHVGDLKEVKIEFPDYVTNEFSGKNATFNVKVVGLEKKIMPEINDDFAKKLGIDTCEKLIETVVEQMIELQNVSSQREFENKIVEHIIKDSSFELPDSLIGKEVDYLLQDVRIQCENAGKKWDDFKGDEKNKDLLAKATDAAKNRISVDLVLNAIVKTENITASDDEIDTEMKLRISQMGEKGKSLETNKSFRNTIQMVILRNKAVDFLIKQNEPLWEEDVKQSKSKKK